MFQCINLLAGSLLGDSQRITSDENSLLLCMLTLSDLKHYKIKIGSN